MPTAVETALGVEVLVAIFLGVRAYRQVLGVPLSVARLVAFPVLASALYLLAAYGAVVSLPYGVPYQLAADLALIASGAAVPILYASRFIDVYPSGGDLWFYRYGYELIGLYLGLWVVRLGLAAYYDPQSLLVTYPIVTPPLGAAAAAAMTAVQLLFSLGTGLVVGRSIATWRLYLQRRAASPTLPSSAPRA